MSCIVTMNLVVDCEYVLKFSRDNSSYIACEEKVLKDKS